jgi:hypothetical protein
MTYIKSTLVFLTIFVLNACRNKPEPITITQAGLTFQAPLGLDSLATLIPFDSVFYCDGHDYGYIAEKYDSVGAKKVTAYYLRSKDILSFRGINFYYPIDSIANARHRSALEEQWKGHFTKQHVGSGAAYTEGYDGYWDMSISKDMSILLYKSGSIRIFEKSPVPDDSLHIIHMEKGVANYFVVAYVRRFWEKNAVFEAYSKDKGFDFYE